MKTNDKQKTFEYASLVMGSKDIPLSSFPQRKQSALNSSKGFTKKNDLLNAKYSKLRHNKIRTKNDRPDIFLEGEQLSRVNTAWQHEVDMRYFENIKEKMRSSTPSGFLKTVNTKIKTPAPRSTPAHTEIEE